MKAIFDKEKNILATFPNKTSQKKIKQIIYNYFEPLFYQECCEMSYDYRNDKRQVKHKIQVFTNDGINYIFYGKSWSPGMETALKNHPIGDNNICSDAVVVKYKLTVEMLPKAKEN